MGCSSFVGLSVRSARQLEAVQQKALSICSVDSDCIPSLSERRSSVSLRLFFSILDDNVPDHLSGFLSLAICPHCHFTHTTQFICHSPSTPSHIPVSVLSSLPHSQKCDDTYTTSFCHFLLFLRGSFCMSRPIFLL